MSSPNDSYFQALYELYESNNISLREKIISELVQSNQVNNAIEYISKFISSTEDFPQSKATNIFDFLVDIALVTQNNFNFQILSLFMKVLGLKPVPSSFGRLSAFLEKVFCNLHDYDCTDLYNQLSTLPIDVALLPLSYFAVQNPDYMNEVFALASTQVEQHINSKIAPLWYQSISVMLDSKKEIDFDYMPFLSSVSSALKNNNVQISYRFELLNSVLQYFSVEQALPIAKSDYKELVQQMGKKGFSADDALSGMLLSITFYGLCEENEKEMIVRAVFDTILTFFIDEEKLKQEILKFCSMLPQEQLKENILKFVTADQSPECSSLLISNFPDDDIVPLILRKNESYDSVVHFLKNFQPPVQYLPRIIEVLKLSDLSLLDQLFKDKQATFCSALIKFFANRTDIEKMIYFDKKFQECQKIPLVLSKSANQAFVSVSTQRIEISNKPIELLFDYLRASSIYANQNIPKSKNTEPKVRRQSEQMKKLMNQPILELTEEEIIDEVSSYYLTSSFVKPEAGKAPAQIIRDIVSKDTEWNSILIGESLDKLLKGEKTAAIMIGALTEDPGLIHNCVQLLQDNHSLLSMFFAVSASIAPNQALLELRNYMEEIPPKKGKGLFSKAQPFSVIDRFNIALHALITMSPYVPFSQLIQDILLNVFESPTARPLYTVACDAIKSICSYIPRREVLDPLLENLCHSINFAEPKSFLEALISLLKVNQCINNSDLISQTWIKYLISNGADVDCEFESVYLDHHYASITFPSYIHELEVALMKYEDQYQLYLSLQRIMSIKYIDQNTLQRFQTLFISSILSKNQNISLFCAARLKELLDVKTEFIRPTGKVLSYEYVQCVKPFFDELASKYTDEKAPLIVNALIQLFQTIFPNSRPSISLFIQSMIELRTEDFLKSKYQFVTKIFQISRILKLDEDFPLMNLHFKILEKLALQDMPFFFYQYIQNRDNSSFQKFFNERFTRSLEISDLLFACVANEIFLLRDLEDFDIEKITICASIIQTYIQHFVSEKSNTENLATILYYFILFLSTLKIKAKQVQTGPLLQMLHKSMRTFEKNTNISVAGFSISISYSNHYFASIERFVKRMSFLPTHLMVRFVTLVHQLENSPHSQMALILSASLLDEFSESRSNEIKVLREKLLNLYFALLKDESLSEETISFSVSKASSSFTPATVELFSQEHLIMLLNAVYKNAMRKNIVIILILPTIIQKMEAENLQKHGMKIIKIVRYLTKEGIIDVKSPEILEILLTLVQKVQEPTWFIKLSTIDFVSLFKLLINGCDKVNDILKALLTGNEDLSYESMFSSLVSIYMNNDGKSRGYVEMALTTMRFIEKKVTISKNDMDLIGFMFQPLISVGDQYCNDAIRQFIQFLKSTAKSLSPVCEQAIRMMTQFSYPKLSSTKKAVKKIKTKAAEDKSKTEESKSEQDEEQKQPVEETKVENEEEKPVDDAKCEETNAEEAKQEQEPPIEENKEEQPVEENEEQNNNQEENRQTNENEQEEAAQVEHEEVDNTQPPNEEQQNE